MAPAVTVIIPTFNRPEMIRASIESALAQTYDDFVISVGDNGGSPLTEEVVRSYDDPRIRYLRREESVGGMGNWLGLIDQADSPLVASLHDDDTWEPTFLEKVVPGMLADPSISVGFTDFWTVDTEGDRLVDHTEWLTVHSTRHALPAGRVELSKEDLLWRVVVRGAAQPAYAAVLRRQAVVDTVFPREIAPLYDVWLMYRTVARGEAVSYVPERLTNYRVWPGSLTAAGYSRPLDAVYGHMVAENGELTGFVDELEREWALDRYRRGWGALDDPTQREQSMKELRRATPGLSGRRWLMAEAASRSTLGWDATRALRSGVRAAKDRVRPQRLDSSGLPDGHMTPTDEAKKLKH